MPDDHAIQVLIEALQDKFDGGGDQALKVDLYWGVKDLNTDGGSYWDSSFTGLANMDSDFDLSSREA